MNVIDKDTVIVTKTGNMIIAAGDIVVESEKGTAVDVRKKQGAPPVEQDKEWQAGRPIEIIAGEKKLRVSRARLRPSWGDMDVALPQVVKRKREKLIKQRMEQERL